MLRSYERGVAQDTPFEEILASGESPPLLRPDSRAEGRGQRYAGAPHDEDWLLAYHFPKGPVTPSIE